ncbi:MAG: NAD(P)-dependent oxidoreductase [Planctomycetota bacterium]
MRVAVTGASGFIGSRICADLRRRGHAVVGLVRETSNWRMIQADCERLVYGDHADETLFRELTHDCDAVVHNSFDWTSIKGGHDQRGGLRKHLLGNLIGSIRLLEVTAPRPFVYLSSIAVHHDILPRWDNAPDEDHPLRPSTPYGACKAAVEAHLWAEHFGRERHTVAIRPAAVYGVDPKLDRSIAFGIIRRIVTDRQYEKSGGGKFVHVDDVTATVAASLEQEAAAGQAFNLADCYARWSDFAVWAADILKIRPEVVETSPAASVNRFETTRAKALSTEIDLERGQAGLREYLGELIGEMSKAGLTKS